MMPSSLEESFVKALSCSMERDDTNSEVEVLTLEAREKLDKISQQHLHIQRLLHEMENENANNVKESVKNTYKGNYFYDD